MKFFDPSAWKIGQSATPVFGPILEGLDKLRATVAPETGTRTSLRDRAQVVGGAISYPLTPAFIRTFATSGLPFLTFYEFTDLAGWHRDTYFAPDHVGGYAEDIGKAYTVWTHETTSTYRRHIFLDEISKDMRISFSVPDLEARSWFPLRIRIHDGEGVCFQHDQKLVVDRLSEQGARLTSWKKIPTLREALPHLHRTTGAAA